MRRITFDPAQLVGGAADRWRALADQAEAATRALFEDRRLNREHRWRRRAWKGLKEFLATIVFYGNCAYCEAYVASVYPEDADHHRPKGKVTQRDGERESAVICADGQPHPGYYWLAYDWRNILPSCSLCNSAPGKGTQFPAQRHVCSPTEGEDPEALDALEAPFLLNPYRRNYDPAEYLVFDDTGRVEARNGNEAAAISIAVYRLNREGLAARRREQQRLAKDVLRRALVHATKYRVPVGDPLREYRLGIQPHSTAALQNLYRHLLEDNAPFGETPGTESPPELRAPLSP